MIIRAIFIGRQILSLVLLTANVLTSRVTIIGNARVEGNSEEPPFLATNFDTARN